MLTPKQLSLIMPKCPQDKLDSYARQLSVAMAEGQINTITRVAAFLGQIAWESNQLLSWEENLKYSASQLMNTWSGRFTTITEAKSFEYKPEKIASHVYSTRFGNGDENSGDGWRYRGRGPIQLTFKDNYKAAGAALGVDLVQFPDKVILPDVGFRVAVWYCTSRSLNVRADNLDFDGITLAINGAATVGPPSYHEKRMLLINNALAVLGVTASF